MKRIILLAVMMLLMIINLFRLKDPKKVITLDNKEYIIGKYIDGQAEYITEYNNQYYRGTLLKYGAINELQTEKGIITSKYIYSMYENKDEYRHEELIYYTTIILTVLSITTILVWGIIILNKEEVNK